MTPAAGAASRAGSGWLRRLVGYCTAHRALLSVALGAALVGALIAAAVPLVIRHVVDSLLAGGRHPIAPWVGVLVVAALAQYATTFARRYCAGKLAQEVQYDLRRDIFTALLRLDGRQQDGLDTGQVVSRSIGDVGIIQGVLSFMPILILNALLFVVALVVMLVLSPPLTLVTLAVAPTLAVIGRRARNDLFPANWSAQQQSGELIGHVEAAVTGVRVVKGFGQEGRELAELEGQARILFGLRMRVVRFTARYAPTLGLVPAVGQVGVLLLGGWLALRGHLTLGTFLAFSAYLGALVSPVRQLTVLLTVGPQARAGMQRVLDIVDTTPGVVDPSTAVALPDGPLGIDFTDVHFGYGDDEVLRGLDLSIAPGETVAVVGGAGSGKSTLAQLVGRFYDIAAGSVSVGGVDVRRLALASLRGAAGYVFEESFLFSDTVAANIAYARPDARRDEVVAAARLAEADGFVTALPGGYDTVVGERGLTLSGGQRQRIALARALLAGPRLLIMDDATSAVDPRVEARINAGLRGHRGRTTLLIAHRRSSLELADRIVVLADGRVAASGTFEELQRDSALFNRLFSPDSAEPIESGRVAAAQSTDRAASTAVATGMRGGRGSWMTDAAPATPELLAQVDALPPATDEPDIPDSLAHAEDPQFGLRHLVEPVRGLLTAGLVLVGLDAVAQLIVPAVVRGGIDRGVTAGSLTTLFWLSGFGLAVLLVDWAIARSAELVTGRMGERLLYLLRVKTFAHLQRLGLDYYERELGGRIMTRMTTDVDALSDFLQTGLTSTFVSLMTLLGVLVALVLLDGSLSLVLIAMLPLLIAATVLFRARQIPVYNEARDRVSVVNAALQENVAGLRVTQAFVREQTNRSRFLADSRAYLVSRMRAQRYIAVYFPFVQFLSDLAAALVLGFGAVRLRDGTLTAGALIAFFLYLDAFFGPVQQLSQVFDGYQQASIGLSRLRELLRTRTTTPQAEHPAPVGELRGDIELRDVRFRYAGTETEAIAGVDLRVSAGSTVALVGETGAGKSSVVKLVARFYDPTAGAVLVDGHDLRGLDLTGYRQRLGLVPQEPYLSAGTVRQAIAYGRPDAGLDEVVAAARRVGAHQTIEALPGGYDHDVGERGRNLSAGQRQLVALARAELVEPDVLLLDEATAALDLASEAAVNRATGELTRQRTTLVVAHRLSTAARADRIVVLDNGRIVEDGSHDELLAADGTYAELWNSYADRPVENARR